MDLVADTAFSAREPELILRPSFSASRREKRAGRGAAVAGALAAGFSGLAFASRNGVWLFAVGFCGGGVLLLAHIALYLRNASIFVTAHSFGQTTWLGQARTFERSQLHRVVLRAVSCGVSAGGQPEMYFLDSNGRTIMTIKGGGWRPEQLSQLWSSLDVIPEGSLTTRATLEDLSRVVRVSWVCRNYQLVTVFITFVLIFAASIVLVRLGVHVRR